MPELLRHPRMCSIIPYYNLVPPAAGQAEEADGRAGGRERASEPVTKGKQADNT